MVGVRCAFLDSKRKKKSVEFIQKYFFPLLSDGFVLSDSIR